jgi:hypothetical protein
VVDFHLYRLLPALANFLDDGRDEFGRLLIEFNFEATEAEITAELQVRVLLRQPLFDEVECFRV